MVSKGPDSQQDKAEKRPVGRPPISIEEFESTICRRLMEGETLTRICQDDDMPGLSTVYRWIYQSDKFREAFLHARKVQSWAWADESRDIAEEIHTHAHGAPGTGEASAKVAAHKIRIDTRMRLIGLLNPKDFSPTQKQEHSGPGGKPIQTESIGPAVEAKVEEIADRRSKLESPRK